jgi:hypothetical protein
MLFSQDPEDFGQSQAENSSEKNEARRVSTAISKRVVRENVGSARFESAESDLSREGDPVGQEIR